jgi:hypothetical protein
MTRCNSDCYAADSLSHVDFALGSALACRRSRTASTCPNIAASIRGVLPMGLPTNSKRAGVNAQQSKEGGRNKSTQQEQLSVQQHAVPCPDMNVCLSIQQGFNDRRVTAAVAASLAKSCMTISEGKKLRSDWAGTVGAVRRSTPRNCFQVRRQTELSNAHRVFAFTSDLACSKAWTSGSNWGSLGRRPKTTKSGVSPQLCWLNRRS